MRTFGFFDGELFYSEQAITAEAMLSGNLSENMSCGWEFMSLELEVSVVNKKLEVGTKVVSR